MDIGRAIKTIRKERGLTQNELSSKIGISNNGISQIECGHVFPSKQNIDKICKVLEVPQSYLLLFSISDEDVPKDARVLLDALIPPLKKILINKKNNE